MRVLDAEATGKNIRQIMDSTLTDPNTVARVLGITKPAIYKWWHGVNLPQMDNMIILADMMGCKLDDIIITKEEASVWD